MPIPGVVPNLVVAQRVINKMKATAKHFIEDETGEAMVGVITPDPSSGTIPTLYILDTISPDESAVRQLHTFQQGDARQDELIWWLQENWHVKRQQRGNQYGQAQQEKWDVPLRYLGDWHKQPGFMIAPSGGDLMTALDWLDDDENGMDYLLAPIVTLGHPPTTALASTNVNYLTVPLDNGTAMRIDFWYIHRDVRMFHPIVPAVYPDDQLPTLEAYPWHIINEDRATLEFARFDDNDIAYSVLLSDTDEELPLEICVTAARPQGQTIFLIATAWNYPSEPPEVRMTPFLKMEADETIADVFDTWWEQAEPVPAPKDWKWNEETHLIDYIQIIEAELAISLPDDQQNIPEEDFHDMG